MRLRVTGELWYWRGPAPFHFVTVPPAESADIASLAASVTYGWGMILVTVWLGDTEWSTSLWPKGGAYIVPIKQRVQRAEGAEIGDTLELELVVRG